MTLSQILAAEPEAYPRLLTAEDNGFQYHIAADAPGSTATLLSSGIAGLDPLPGFAGIRGLSQASGDKAVVEEAAHMFTGLSGTAAGSLYAVDLANSPRTVSIDPMMASRVEFARIPSVERIASNAGGESTLLTTNLVVSSMPELTSILLAGSMYQANYNSVVVHDCPKLEQLMLSPLTGGAFGGSIYYGGGPYATVSVGASDVPCSFGYVTLSGAFPSLTTLVFDGARLQQLDLSGVTELHPACFVSYGSGYINPSLAPDPVLIDFIRNLDRLGWAGSAVLSVQTTEVFDQTVDVRANISLRGGTVVLI
jgi:hypothetical protein